MRPSDLADATRVRADLCSGDARRARKAAGVAAADIAQVIGVSRQAVASWETGGAVPTIAHAVAYGRLLRQLARMTA